MLAKLVSTHAHIEKSFKTLSEYYIKEETYKKPAKPYTKRRPAG